MHTVPPLPVDGVLEEERRQLVIKHVDGILKANNCTRSKLRRVFKVRADGPLSGDADFTSKTLRCIFQIFAVSSDVQDAVRRAYIGKEPADCREHLQAHLRWHGDYKELAKKVGCSTGELQCILYGQKRKGNTPDTPPRFPDYPLWKKLAEAMGMEEGPGYDIWLASARDHWKNLGRNVLGAEVETVLMESGKSRNYLVDKRTPKALQELDYREADELIQDLRYGELRSLADLRVFCDALRLQKARREKVFDAAYVTHLNGILASIPHLDKPEFADVQAAQEFYFHNDPVLQAYRSQWPNAAAHMFQSVCRHMTNCTSLQQMRAAILAELMESCPEFEECRHYWYWNRWVQQVAEAIHQVSHHASDVTQQFKDLLQQLMHEHHAAVATLGWSFTR